MRRRYGPSGPQSASQPRSRSGSRTNSAGAASVSFPCVGRRPCRVKISLTPSPFLERARNDSCAERFISETAERKLMLGTILIIVLILLLIGALPNWPHSASWGYGPSGLLGTVLV